MKKSLIIVAMLATLTANVNAIENGFNKSYKTKDIAERYTENPYALFVRASKIMDEKNPNYKKALQLFEKSSGLGIAEASHNAGYIYYNGLGSIEKDIKKAASFFLSGAQRGIVDSQMMLGQMFVDGSGLQVNAEQAYKWFYKAANSGVLEAKYYIANMIFHGKGTSMDSDLGIKILEEVAEETQNRKIFFELGEIHRRGVNSPKDYHLALINHEKAANLGFSKSQKITGDLYRYGRGDKANNEKALYWYTKAALLNNVESMPLVGEMHLYGNGTKKDVMEAEKWFEKGAKNSNSESLYNLASLYMKNEHGVDPDYSKAIGFYHKAVNVGNKEAIRELAVIYRKGIDGVLEPDTFTYTDLMNLYYKEGDNKKVEKFNMFTFKDDQDVELEKQKIFHKGDFEKYLK